LEIAIENQKGQKIIAKKEFGKNLDRIWIEKFENFFFLFVLIFKREKNKKKNLQQKKIENEFFQT